MSKTAGKIKRNRYISLYRLFDQLDDKDKEDVAWFCIFKKEKYCKF